MSKNLIKTDGSTIYAHIEAANMPESERESALNALAMAEAMVDAVMWVSRKLGEVGSHLFLKPGVKH
jgi:hypothetical protein